MLISTGFPGSRLCSFKSSQFILDDGTFLVLFNKKKQAGFQTCRVKIKIYKN